MSRANLDPIIPPKEFEQTPPEPKASVEEPKALPAPTPIAYEIPAKLSEYIKSERADRQRAINKHSGVLDPAPTARKKKR